MKEVLPDNPIAIGGGVAASLFGMGMLLSRFRAVWSRDSADAAAAVAQTTVIEMLRGENERLHSQVLALQQEVAKLQQLVAELTAKLSRFEMVQYQQDQINQLAREGKIERRNSVAMIMPSPLGVPHD